MSTSYPSKQSSPIPVSKEKLRRGSFSLSNNNSFTEKNIFGSPLKSPSSSLVNNFGFSNRVSLGFVGSFSKDTSSVQDESSSPFNQRETKSVVNRRHTLCSGHSLPQPYYPHYDLSEGSAPENIKKSVSISDFSFSKAATTTESRSVPESFEGSKRFSQPLLHPKSSTKIPLNPDRENKFIMPELEQNRPKGLTGQQLQPPMKPISELRPDSPIYSFLMRNDF